MVNVQFPILIRVETAGEFLSVSEYCLNAVYWVAGAVYVRAYSLRSDENWELTISLFLVP